MSPAASIVEFTALHFAVVHSHGVYPWQHIDPLRDLVSPRLLNTALACPSRSMSFNDELDSGTSWRLHINPFPRPANAPSNAKWYPKCHVCAKNGREVLGLVDEDDTSHKCPACGHHFEGCEHCAAVFRWTTPDGKLIEWRYPTLGYWRM
jgi:predicted RNA-binding Zn-ribbon protein involved in translation (DUF1610 family)